MSKLLLKNAVLATPERIIRNDLLIEDKIITKIDRDISCDDAKIIDCHEYVVLPGLIDEHVHFRQPGMEQKATIYSESRAALLGGVTSYLDMPNNNPSTCTMELLNAKKRLQQKTLLQIMAFILALMMTI